MPDEVHETIRAKRFELVDDRGLVRAMLYWHGEDTAALEFFEDGQTSRVGIGINPEGTAIVTLRDSAGTIRARIASERSGEPTLFTIRAAPDKIRAQIALDHNGGVGVTLTDQAGRKRTSLEVQPDGLTTLLMYDKDGNPIEGVAGANPDRGQ